MRPNTPVKVYVAAPWKRRLEAIEAGKVLAAAGFELTSGWFYETEVEGDLTAGNDALRPHALRDLQDVSRSDVIVVLNLEKSEGKAVETGAALISAIPVISVYGRSNIFQSLGIEVDTLDAAIAAIHTLYPRQVPA